MNRSILIVICDFLLLSLLTFSTDMNQMADDNTQRSAHADVTTNEVVQPGKDLMALMTSWKRGRDLLLARWRQDSLPLAPFLARLPQSRTVRVPGMAIFLTGNPDYVPTSLLHNLKHNKVLHERVVLCHVQVDNTPVVPDTRRLDVKKLGKGFYDVVIHHGFFESPDVPKALQLVKNLIEAYGEDIKTLAWMSPATRAKAEALYCVGRCRAKDRRRSAGGSSAARRARRSGRACCACDRRKCARRARTELPSNFPPT